MGVVNQVGPDQAMTEAKHNRPLGAMGRFGKATCATLDFCPKPAKKKPNVHTT